MKKAVNASEGIGAATGRVQNGAWQSLDTIEDGGGG